MQFTDVISPKVIQDADQAGACSTGLDYAKYTPKLTYNKLYHNRPAYLVWLARNTAIPSVIKLLASHRSAKIREYVARNENASLPIQRQLAADKNFRVRLVLSWYTRSKTILKILAKDKHKQVLNDAQLELSKRRSF